MLRSMFSGVSGLRLHQTKMDVIGNNIANVNTVAFKGSRVTFNDIFSQTIRSASAPVDTSTGRGGTNPYQVGLGVAMASIDIMQINGGPQRTDKATDLAIEGSGFFAVTDGISTYYTRAGNFDIDGSGYLAAPGGLKVLGWLFDPNQNGISRTGQPQEINLSNLVLPPKSTTGVTFEGNLDDSCAINDTHEYHITIFDSKGDSHNLTYTFEKTNDNEWSYTVVPSDPSLTIIAGGTGTLTFDTNGRLDSANSTIPSTTVEVPGTDPIEFTPEFSEEKFTQYADESSVEAVKVDGYRSGILNGISVDSEGYIVCTYTNGYSRRQAQVAIAQFTNPAGLEKMGNNLFRVTVNSGDPALGVAGQDGRGIINAGALEMSNIDLATEFTDMIATQRGFQANSRVITTSDELLQELVNLKR